MKMTEFRPPGGGMTPPDVEDIGQWISRIFTRKYTFVMTKFTPKH